MSEIYQLPQGKIIIAYNDERLSIGLLFLNPHQEYPMHNRPVVEQLLQVNNDCVMKLFENEKMTQEITLKENQNLIIPANQYHMHTNPFDTPSITLWKFEGNILEVLEKIRQNNTKII